MRKDKSPQKKKKVRSKFRSERPRLSVFRSNKHLYAQIIDDNLGETLVSASDKRFKKDSPKSEIAFSVGSELAKKAIKKGIQKVLFDRGGYKYHGRVKALAEGARKEGLKF